MGRGRISKLLSLVVLPCLAGFGTGCGLVDVDMTSAPANVKWGEPVTFDIKFTNRSQCPVKTATAVLLPFIPIQQFNFTEIDGGGGSPPPPEDDEFLKLLREFFDELCAGGEPTPPDTIGLRGGCERGLDEVVCTISGAAPAQADGGGSRTLATLGKRLRCEIDAGTMQCTFRMPLPGGAAAEGSAATMTQSISCSTLEELGMSPLEIEGAFLCFVGTFPAIQGLGPGEMATGQFTLPARGAGTVRNLIFGISDDPEEDLGVCKGGDNAGGGCIQGRLADCPDGLCLEGICVDGPNQGQGCDQETTVTDCGTGATCALCSEPTGGAFLPLDCTTTYIQPNPAPMASPWGLIGLAVTLCAGGYLWLRRRTTHWL